MRFEHFVKDHVHWYINIMNNLALPWQHVSFCIVNFEMILNDV